MSQVDPGNGDPDMAYESPDSPLATLSEVLGHAQIQTQRIRHEEAWTANLKRTDRRKRPMKAASRTLRQTAIGEVDEHTQRGMANGRAPESTTNASRCPFTRQSHPQERPTQTGSLDPFNAFPVQINDKFLDIFDRYYRGYRWEQSKRKLLAETASDALLGHSFLAIAHNVYHPNRYEALDHETQTIQAVSQALRSGKTLSTASATVPLAWAISRLAMIRAQQGDWEAALRHMNACAVTCGPVPSVINHKFGSHLLCTFMIVLLSNFMVTRSVVPNLWRPYGDPPSSILAEVEALGFKLPLASLMSLRSQDIDSELRDILCALSALCFPVPCAAESHATHLVRQGIEMLKIGLWLAELSPLNHDALSNEEAPLWHTQLQQCLRLAALLFVLSPSPVSRDATRQLRQTMTPQLLLLATASQDHAKTASAALPFWILLVCGATAHDAADQMHFAKLIMRFYPGFLDHAISGPEVPFSRLSGKFLPPTLDCLIAGVHNLNSANGWMFTQDESWQRDQSSMSSTGTGVECNQQRSRSNLQNWRTSSIGGTTESSSKYFLDLYIQITGCGPNKTISQKACGIDIAGTAENQRRSFSVGCEVDFENFSIDEEFLAF